MRENVCGILMCSILLSESRIQKSAWTGGVCTLGEESTFAMRLAGDLGGGMLSLPLGWTTTRDNNKLWPGLQKHAKQRKEAFFWQTQEVLILESPRRIE